MSKRNLVDQETEKQELLDRIEELESVLELALNQQVANRGTKHEFYMCYSFDQGKFPAWVTEAKKALRDVCD
jgi:hypothetical protein